MQKERKEEDRRGGAGPVMSARVWHGRRLVLTGHRRLEVSVPLDTKVNFCGRDKGFTAFLARGYIWTC